MNKLLRETEESIQKCLTRDRPRFSRRLKNLQHLQKKGRDIGAELEGLQESIERSSESRSRRSSSIPKIHYPDLPVSDRREEIAQAILDNQVVIVCGETGSGKSTQLPKICLSIGRGTAGTIGHTQPRRLAASTLARRIAEEIGHEVGGLIGYKIRFQDKSQPRTLVKLMTDGILLAEIQSDPYLNEYDTLILDEAHERSLNIDFLLGYLKWLLPKRPDLKVIVTSATIDPESFAKHFDGAPVIEVSGRTYPVETRYRPVFDAEEAEGEGDLLAAILAAVEELLQCQDGDILVFLSGEREIRESAEMLRKRLRNDCEILPLFSRLNAKDQEKIFHGSGRRRIVLSTNIAETSLTVPGIRCVIDTGLARISRYSVRSKIQRLPVEKISQASANQRAGRCGRLGPGICIRLYSEEEFQERSQFTDPEILRTNLAAVILQMKALRLGEIEGFPFIEAPDPRLIRDGIRLLEELNAIDSKKELTEIGRGLARIPLDPRLGRILLAAKDENCLAEIAVIVSALSIQDPRERPAEQSAAADEKHKPYLDRESDFLSFLHLWKALEEQREALSNTRFRVFCRDHFLSYRRIREWRDIYLQLMQSVESEFRFRVNQVPADYQAIHQALLSGLLSNIGFLRDQSEYLGARNLKFHIHPGSALFKARPKWIMAAEQVETGRVYGRNVAKVAPEWIEAVGAHLVRLQHFDPHWEKNQGRVAVFEKSTLFGLTLQNRRKIPYERIDPAGAREIFIRSALVAQDFESNARFFQHNRALLEEFGYLQQKGRRVDLVVDDESLFDFFDDRIPETVVDANSFNRWRRQIERSQPDLLCLSREDICGEQESVPALEQYPDQMKVGESTVQLVYRFEPGHAEDGVTAMIPLFQLNQVVEEPFEWLVPGLLKDKVTALIKALPKSIRRNFVPAQDYADRFLAEAEPKGSLLKSLAAWLSAEKPVNVSPTFWSDCGLPDHLSMHFQVVDKDGKTLASGRDLKSLQIRLADDSKQVFTSLAKRELLKSGCSRWEFGEIPESQLITQNAGQTIGYPALVDEGETVGLRLFDNARLARINHEFGLARLFMISLRGEISYLKKMIRAKQNLLVWYGRVDPHPFQADLVLQPDRDLDADLLPSIVRAVFLEGEPRIAKESDFQNRLAQQKHRLVETAERQIRLIGETAQLAIEIRGKLDRIRLHSAVTTDIREQLSLLIYRGFLARTPATRLESFPRYLRAISHRIDKAAGDESRDLKQMKDLEPLWSSYWNSVKHSPGPIIPELDDYRWRLEELRVSLFAQSLKTPYPVSCKRLEKIWAARL
ncbi:MAG: ATP-dependent RNA helicase HrpA [Gammaproteobacteria bacterium]